MISFLWAEDENGLIGKNNELPWRLPADLKYFKETTMGHPIVMGRKTFESIGKPLPGRKSIILTRDKTFQAEDCLVFHSKDELLEWIEQYDSEVFITGGSEIFRLFLDEVDRLYVTKIHCQFEGDTYFPDVNWDEWRLVSTKPGPKNEKNPYDYEFLIYERS
ncbi:dihydrofolate reductase [Bacillus thermophilus]|uniref:Dihydrofolate reductase n=1 Tax=Siminovitchia thermophila TaxID=1245522 RepID=A0ABS2R9R8_9BACI|nr:dihydrofolate reductase [Siminovitchia thermophila]MBM7716408.1 dihydrofolate reductase [Siminovitchia thermophila]ONK21962.1 dihydrofolate reductase [Bacillus sp. VT-16-64]